MKYFFIVGEKSGDLHGSNLILSLKEKDSNAVFKGYGGDLMQSSGMHLLVHFKEYSVMGFSEVILKVFTIRKFLNSAKEDIKKFRPDVLVLIDFGGFNMRMAAFAKQEGIRVVYYIPPKVWAWNTGRAKKLKENVDQLLTILPFEKKFYRDMGWEVDFVGNPVNDSVRNFSPESNFASDNRLLKNTYVALLPGSRAQELEKTTQLFLDLARKYSTIDFLLAGVTNLDKSYYTKFETVDNISVIFDKTYDILSMSKAAIVTSGTATLETSLIGIPQVVVYKTSPVSYSIAKRVIKVPYISLVNLILDRELVIELIQEEADVERISIELKKLLNDLSYREYMRDGYAEIAKMFGDGSASDNAATKILEGLNSN